MQVEGLVQNELAECASRKVSTGKFSLGSAL